MTVIIRENFDFNADCKDIKIYKNKILLILISNQSDNRLFLITEEGNDILFF